MIVSRCIAAWRPSYSSAHRLFQVSPSHLCNTSVNGVKSVENNKESTPDLTDELKTLRSDFEKLRESHSHLEDKYKRALAESENMRVRLTKQIEEAKLFGIQSFCKDLLDIADVLTKAMESAPKDQLVNDVNPPFVSLYNGLKMTEQQILKVFARHKLFRIQPTEGDRFDPNIHEAVFQAPLQEGKQPNTVAIVTNIGYRFHDRTLRPAYVGVYGP
ncbi:unnamed protein product [Dicrocoelium dendriticum]|nr:unnamed protein product [Dicrocoelium dendriticum]